MLTMTEHAIPSVISVQQASLLYSSSPETSVVLLSETEERSLCDGLNGIYSVWFHVAAVIIILLASLIGTALPIMAKYVPSFRANPYYFSLGKTAATGVLLSVATIHLINEASKAFEEYCVPSFFKNYNAYSFLFALMAALMMQAIDLQLATVAERWLKAKHENSQIVEKELVEENKSSSPLTGRGVSTATASTRASDVVIESAEQHVSESSNNYVKNNIDAVTTHYKKISTSDNDNNSKHESINANSSQNSICRLLWTTNTAVNNNSVDINSNKEKCDICEEMQNCTLPISDNSNMITTGNKPDNDDNMNNDDNNTATSLQYALEESTQRQNKTTNTAIVAKGNKYNGHNTEHVLVMREKECNNTNVERLRCNHATNAKQAEDEVLQNVASKVNLIVQLQQHEHEQGEQEECESRDKYLHDYCSELLCNTKQEHQQQHKEENKEKVVMSDWLSHLNVTDNYDKSEEECNHLHVPTMLEHACYSNAMNDINSNTNDGSNNGKSHIVSVENPDNCNLANVEVNESIYASHGHSHHIIIPPEEMNSIRRVIAAVCMEFGVTLHSVFVGLAVGFTTNDELKPLLVALIFHQMFEGMAMGSRLVDAQFHKALETTLAIVFATSAPLGIIIGIIAATISPSTMAGGGFVMMLAILDAFCGGILLYLAFNLLLFDFANDLRTFSADDVPNRRWKKTGLYVALWFGMLLMALVGKWL